MAGRSRHEEHGKSSLTIMAPSSCVLTSWQNSKEVAYFEKDKNAAKEPVKKYGAGDETGDAPKQDFST